MLAHLVRKIVFIYTLLISTSGYSQIFGKVIDSVTNTPVEFVNVWVKNTMKGTTTNSKGAFEFESAKVGDQLMISYLGYEEIEFTAKTENLIKLKPISIELAEVLIMPMKGEEQLRIDSYKKYKKIRDFYFNGHYSLARFYEYKVNYEQTPFINKVSIVVSNSLKNNAKFKMYLVKADKTGKPSKQKLSEYYILESENGQNEVSIELTEENILFPEEGFFVVVERLNLEENKFSNKIASNILQPAIGMERENSENNTWLGFSGKWITPKELIKFAGSNKNIAVNIELTN